MKKAQNEQNNIVKNTGKNGNVKEKNTTKQLKRQGIIRTNFIRVEN